MPGHSSHHLVNVNLCINVSVVIHSHIISIQLWHQDCRYAMIRVWNLPDKIIALKYVNERNSWEVETIQPRIEIHVVGNLLARGEQGDIYFPSVRIQNDHFRGVLAVKAANKQAMLSFVKR